MSVETVPSVADLTEMVEQVWMSYLDPEGIDPLIPSEEEHGESEVHSSVAITGSWQGAVGFGSSQAAARNIAAAFLQMEPGEVSEEDLADVLGEMANIIGGNVKSLLPQPCALSLPQVLVEEAITTWYLGVTEVCQLDGVWLDEPVTVRVLESTADVVGVRAA